MRLAVSESEEFFRHRSRRASLVVFGQAAEDREVIAVRFLGLDTILIVLDTVERPTEDTDGETTRDEGNDQQEREHGGTNSRPSSWFERPGTSGIVDNQSPRKMLYRFN